MKKGFTLIELMIVIVIITILVALAVPAIKGRKSADTVGISSHITTPSPDRDQSQGKLKLIGETSKTKVYEFIDSDHRNCVMVESKYVDEDTTITCN